jgi:hypothetical protein
MSPWQLEDWYCPLRIRRDDRIVLVSMRGRARISTSWTRAYAPNGRRDSGRITPSTSSSTACGPFLTRSVLDEHRDAGRFLVALDALLTEAGIPDALVRAPHGPCQTSGREATLGCATGLTSSGAWSGKTRIPRLRVS